MGELKKDIPDSDSGNVKRKAKDDANKKKTKKHKKQSNEKAASEKRWKTKKEIEKKYSSIEQWAILRLAKQRAKGPGPREVLDDVVDLKLFGALPKCPDCGNYKLRRDAEYVICHGNLSAWTACSYKILNSSVKREKISWPKPEEIADMVEEINEMKRQQKEAKFDTILAAVNSDQKLELTLNNSTIGELRKELEKEGLNTNGNKSVLVERLFH